MFTKFKMAINENYSCHILLSVLNRIRKEPFVPAQSQQERKQSVHNKGIHKTTRIKRSNEYLAFFL